MRSGQRFRLGDGIVLALLVAMAVLLTLSSMAVPRGEVAIVLVDGKAEAVLPLDEPVEIRVQGPIGETLVRVQDNGVEIVESACPHKICVRMGRITMQGQLLICVPNHVVVRIDGGEEGSGVDGVTG
ncbi:hypothetical protein BMS3Bbin04_01903 [bacterium BMS3Bbin04]|nr:hypothetical protein BMS3Bbin04_01903 [bacterium BMS3Bbin04]